MEPPVHLGSLYPGPRAPVISHLGPYSFYALPNWYRRKLAGLRPNYPAVDFQNLGPGASTKLNLNIPPDTWIVATTATCVLASAPKTPAPNGMRVQIFNPLQDAGLSQRPIDTRLAFGTGQLAYVWTHPLHIEDFTPLLIKIANRDLQNAISGELVFQTYF